MIDMMSSGNIIWIIPFMIMMLIFRPWKNKYHGKYMRGFMNNMNKMPQNMKDDKVIDNEKNKEESDNEYESKILQIAYKNKGDSCQDSFRH